MMYDILIFTSALTGIVLGLLALLQLRPDRTFISPDTPLNPRKWRPYFRSRRGYLFAVAGLFLMGFAGVIALVRLIARFLS